MVGVIGFLKAWRDHRLTHQSCKGCVKNKECAFYMTDEEIASIVRKVMAWKEQEEKNK